MSEVETAIVLKMVFWADVSQLSAFTTELFGLATHCWYFHPSPFFPLSFCSVVSVLLCCNHRMFLQVKNRNFPQKSSGRTMFSSFHITDFISALYVVFIIQKSLLNVYLLKIPDMQN